MDRRGWDLGRGAAAHGPDRVSYPKVVFIFRGSHRVVDDHYVCLSRLFSWRERNGNACWVCHAECQSGVGEDCK